MQFITVKQFSPSFSPIKPNDKICMQQCTYVIPQAMKIVETRATKLAIISLAKPAKFVKIHYYKILLKYWHFDVFLDSFRTQLEQLNISEFSFRAKGENPRFFKTQTTKGTITSGDVKRFHLPWNRLENLWGRKFMNKFS